MSFCVSQKGSKPGHSLLHYPGIRGVYAQWMVGLVHRWHTQWEEISLHCE